MNQVQHMYREKSTHQLVRLTLPGEPMILLRTMCASYSHAIFRVETIPPCVPPSDAVSKRGHTTAPPSSLLVSAFPTSQLAHNSRTPSSASGCTTIAKIASTPPAPGTPAHSTPGRADVASTSLVWTGGSIGTPAC